MYLLVSFKGILCWLQIDGILVKLDLKKQLLPDIWIGLQRNFVESFILIQWMNLIDKKIPAAV